MSNTPSKAEIESLAKRHGATSYRNRADTQHPAYGFTEDGLNGLIVEVLAKWGTPQQEAQEPAAYVHVPHYTVEGKVRPVVSFEKYQQDYADGIYSTRIPLYTAPKPAPAPLSDDVVKDAARWRMAALIGNELMLHPDKRTHATAVKAYMDATHSGSDLTGAVDAAIVAQGGKA